jgi:predicted PurR-regulated permease PerM
MVGLTVLFFYAQMRELAQDISLIKNKILLLLANITDFFNANFTMLPKLEKNDLSQKSKDLLNNSTGDIFRTAVDNGAAFFTGLMECIIFSVFTLLYRKGLIQALIQFFPNKQYPVVFKMIPAIKNIGQRYFLELILVVGIIGIFNSVGLWIIGLENPLLFGFLGAALSIIPYVGTISGGAIAVIFAFLTSDSIWMAVQVAILFWAVQWISDNFLSPALVGSSLDLNAFTAILSLIIGAMLWGLSGMILFLPFTAMLKVVCEQYIELKPIATLLGNEIHINRNKAPNKTVEYWKSLLSKMKTKIKKRI